MIDSPDTDITEILLRMVDARLAETHTVIPGRVESYDSSKYKASVQPLVKREYVDEFDEVSTEILPVVHDVPVLMLGTDDGVVLEYPIRSGHTVLLAVSSTSLDKWKQRGGMQEPEDGRHHHLADCVAFPGLRAFAHAKRASKIIRFTETSTIEIGTAGGVFTALDGVVTGQGVDPYTGLKYAVLGNAIASVMVK